MAVKINFNAYYLKQLAAVVANDWAYYDRFNRLRLSNEYATRISSKDFIH